MPGRKNNAIKGNKIRRECNHPVAPGEKGQALIVATMGGLGHSPRAQKYVGGRPSATRKEGGQDA